MIAVIGGSGQVGTAFQAVVPDAAFLDRSDLDLADLDSIGDVLKALAPELVINCAAYTAVDAAESDEPGARVVNALAVERLAVWAAANHARLVTFSTDYVFDGSGTRPYVESDPVSPINAYGRTKLEGERLALQSHPGSLIVRTSWVISGSHRNLVSTILDRARDGELQVVDDQLGSPTIAADLADATMRAIDAELTGILHLTNQGTATWFDLAVAAVKLAGMDVRRISRTTSDAFPRPARRPSNSVLESERLPIDGLERLPHWRDSLPRLVREMLTWL